MLRQQTPLLLQLLQQALLLLSKLVDLILDLSYGILLHAREWFIIVTRSWGLRCLVHGCNTNGRGGGVSLDCNELRNGVI